MKLLLSLFITFACYGQANLSPTTQAILKLWDRVEYLESCLEDLVEVNKKQNILIVSYEARIKELEAKVKELNLNRKYYFDEKDLMWKIRTE